MKVQRLQLENFKRFHRQTFDFRDRETGLAKDLIVLVGQNGSGKSSVLQAIAAVLGAATGRLSAPGELDWPGFDLALANKAWARPASVEIEVEFSPSEVEATRALFARTEMGQDQDKTPPREPRCQVALPV